jgi:hypothetical protein
VIRIGVHTAEEEPNQHVMHLASRVSRTLTVREVLSQNWAPAPGMKSWLLAIVRPGRHPGLPHSPSNKPP